MSDTTMHKVYESGKGIPSYADRAKAGYSTHVVVGTSPSSQIATLGNVVRIYNSHASARVHVVTSTGDQTPNTGDFYPIKAGEIAYLALDTGDTHMCLVASEASAGVWYSFVG